MSNLYRAYHLGPDGHFRRAEVIVADDDADALRKLREVPNWHGLELWDRGRYVGKAAPFQPDQIVA